MAGQTWKEHTYQRSECVIFLKTHEQWGGLSNMAGGYPIVIGETHIRTSEALYQACRFPHMPHIQRLIIEQASPMAAKMKSKPYRTGGSRKDWQEIQDEVMSWCLRVKLAQNWDSFGKLLNETGDRQIVEESRRDTYWGAKPIDEYFLKGRNVLGCLLMSLREEWHANRALLRTIEPLPIDDFLLMGQKIGRVEYEISRLTQPTLFS